MSSVAQAPAKPNTPASAKSASGTDPKKVLIPYLIAIASQLPMLVLYYRDLTSQPHYQPFLIAIIASIAIAVMRWPFGHEKPFHQSLASDVLIVLGLASAGLGVLLVEPWFAALATMLFVTSLFARTLDKETKGTLWPCALPLFVYLALPMGMDVNLITTLQTYSADYTSRMLDLAGLGHHMDGTVINVPGLQEYGIEQACSGVQSFFTLLLVAVVFIVLSRRISVPSLGVAILSLLFAGFLLVMRVIPGISETINTLLLVSAVGFALFAFLGFRAATLILSAVFWAVFVNTIRILTIPLAEYFADIDLSGGISHDILGYAALSLGILMLMSTDQFLLFLFGPVEDADETGPLGKLLGRMWNSLSGKSEEDSSSRRSRSKRRSMTGSNQRFLWIFAGIMLVVGLWQLVDVQRSWASAQGVRFFDSDPTIDFNESLFPPEIGGWQRVDYAMENRSRGSDLGERSDIWKFRSTKSPIVTIVSVDQPFPGWHELTTCYKNVGWKIGEGQRQVMSPIKAMGLSSEADESQVIGDPSWGLVEVDMKKPTGENAYLVFAMCDSFGEGVEPPRRWGSLNSLFIRASNRMSHRIRARLLQGEAYQFQVLLTSFSEIPDEIKQEIRSNFLNLREQFRQKLANQQAANE